MDSAMATQKISERIIYLLQTNGTLDPCQLLSLLDEPLAYSYSALKHLEKKGLIERVAGSITLSVEGRKHTGKESLENLDFICNSCDGRGYTDKFEKPELLRRYESICAGRPRALKEFDQWYMEPRQAFFRLAYMHSRGDLVDRDVFVIGDDDLVGLAAALTGLPRRVLVLEIDERLVEFTNRMAREHGLQERLEARMFDVRQEFPAELRGRFDVFVCDPAETLTGLRLFLSRGAAGLRGEGSAAYFGLTSLEASKAKWLKVQRLCHQMGFLVTDIRRAFTEYPNPGWDPSLAFWAKLEQAPAAPWYRSAFWRLEAVNPPVSALDGPFTGPVEDLYIDDEAWATRTNSIGH